MIVKVQFEQDIYIKLPTHDINNITGLWSLVLPQMAKHRININFF